LKPKGLSIDYDRRSVRRGRKEIHLTRKEFELLSLLAEHAGQLVEHRTILKTIWGPHAVEQPEHVWVLVLQLRKKIEVDPSKPRYVLNHRWMGYRLAVEFLDGTHRASMSAALLEGRLEQPPASSSRLRRSSRRK
jgi:two-component system KDP operon response regulator KdpE